MQLLPFSCVPLFVPLNKLAMLLALVAMDYRQSLQLTAVYTMLDTTNRNQFQMTGEIVPLQTLLGKSLPLQQPAWICLHLEVLQNCSSAWKQW